MVLKNNLYRITTENKEDKSYRLELIPECMIYRAHFPEQPITPGVCIIQIASELLAELYPFSFELSSVSNAKYLAVINPQETRTLTYAFKKVIFDDGKKSVKVSVSVSDNDIIFTKLSLVYKINDIL